MTSSSSLQHLLSLNGQEQIGYFKAGTYPKPAVIKKMKQTKNLRSRLGLINQHIRSLATYPYEGHIYIERSLDHKELIFCICKKCKEKFTLKEHKIFLEEREKEFQRIQKQINKLGSYTKKLDYLFQVKPFNLKRFTINLYDSIEAEKEKIKPILSIDLYPQTPKEKGQAVHLIKQYLIKANERDDPKLLDYKERCVIPLLSVLQEELQERLEKCLDPKPLLEQEISLVQESFQYPSKQYIQHLKNRSYTTLHQNMCYLYNYIADGFSIDYSSIEPEVDTITKVIKAEHAFAYTQHLQSLLQKQETSIEVTSSNKEFTTARQVLALHSILKYCKVDNVDQSKKAAFIHFITGKNKKNVYDLTRSPLSTKTKQFRKKDLQFIRSYFEDLKMEGVIKIINNELAKLDD